MDTEGQVSDPQSFDPFGVPRTTVPQDTGPLAALQDESLGYLGAYGRQGVYGSDMIHMGARVYDPSSGRFTSRDVMPGTDMETQSQNPYAYGLNGPLRFYDLDGRLVEEERELITTIEVGGGVAACELTLPACIAALAVGGAALAIINHQTNGGDSGTPHKSDGGGGSGRPNGVGGGGDGGSGTRPDGPPAKSPVGRRGPGGPWKGPINNVRTWLNGRWYTGHALDQMRDRGYVPSVVENTIKFGVKTLQNGGRIRYEGGGNNVRVITEADGTVVTVF